MPGRVLGVLLNRQIARRHDCASCCYRDSAGRRGRNTGSVVENEKAVPARRYVAVRAGHFNGNAALTGRFSLDAEFVTTCQGNVQSGGDDDIAVADRYRIYVCGSRHNISRAIDHDIARIRWVID